MSDPQYTVLPILNMMHYPEFCAHRNAFGDRCTRPPVWIIVHSSEYAHGSQLWCDDHVRGEILELDGDGPVVRFCAAETSKGEPCSAEPFDVLDGKPLCYAHYRKALLADRAAQKELATNE